MNYTYWVLIVSVFLMFGAPQAHAASASTFSSGRYFVPTTNTFWKNALGARRLIDNGFTADLNEIQIRVARLAGLKLVPVKRFTILADQEATPSPSPDTRPSETISWGVRSVLGLSDTAIKTAGGKGIRVAVLDTGIDREHPDLSSRVTVCRDYADPIKSVNDDSCVDQNGHGTHIAGVIAADGGASGEGMWGIAPEAELLVYRVCGKSGICLADDIAAALVRAVDDGAQIALLGMGSESSSSLVSDAIAYAVKHDVMVIAPAGNSGPDNELLDWPASDARVVSVGAVSQEGEVAEFSSRGVNAKTKSYLANDGDLTLVAPGANIESTFRDQGYAILSGTSMAAPHVAGVAALVWQSHVKNPLQATMTILRASTEDIDLPGDDNASGLGALVLRGEISE